MVSEKWILIGAWTAIVGGMCLTIKGGMILLTGDQPALLIEIAPVFFAVAIVGLFGCLNGRGGWLARAGIVLAVAGGLAALLNSTRELMILITGEAITEFEPLSALAGFGWLLGLLLVGIPIWRTQALPGKWRMIPLFIVTSIMPLIVTFSIVGEVTGMAPDMAERLIEIPLVFLGFIWLGLGRIMLTLPNQAAA